MDDKIRSVLRAQPPIPSDTSSKSRSSLSSGSDRTKLDDKRNVQSPVQSESLGSGEDRSEKKTKKDKDSKKEKSKRKHESSKKGRKEENKRDKKHKKHRSGERSEKDLKEKKEKKRKRDESSSSSEDGDGSSSSDDDNARRSVITGKKIKMNRENTIEDQLNEADRAAKRHYMNSQY